MKEDVINSNLLYYQFVEKFQEYFYRNLITTAHITDAETLFKSIADADGTKQDISIPGYPLVKDNIKYILPSKIPDGDDGFRAVNLSEDLPIVVTRKVKVFSNGVGYFLIKKFKSAKLKSERKMTMRELVNKLCSMKHSNPKHQKLMTMLGLSSMLDRTNFRVCTNPGCVDAETEYLTPTGWKKINEYEDTDKVLQYNKETGYTNFVTPSKYIKYPCKEMYNFKTKFSNQMFSDDHTLLFRKDNGDLVDENTKDFVERHNKSKTGVATRKQLTTFKIAREGINLTEDEIRLMVAIIADGHYLKRVHNPNKVQLQFKKAVKVERLETLLIKMGIKYVKAIYKDGYTRFKFDAPLVAKDYSQFWECSEEQLEIICDEVFHWDGSGNQFFSSNKQSMDFIQYALTNCGFTANINTYYRESRDTVEYTLTKSTKDSFSMSNSQGNHKIELVNNPDGYKYSFTVPSSYLVLRRNDNIFITHNCGKDSIVEICGSLFGSATTIENPTVAKLEYLSYVSWLAVNEVVDIGKAEWRNIEQFLLSAGALKEKITKRSRANGNVGEFLDIGNLSISLFFNDIDTYKDAEDFFDNVAKGAVQDRFLPLRFYGRYEENFESAATVNVENTVKRNKGIYEDIIRTFAYYKQNLSNSLHYYKVKNNPFKGRHSLAFTRILKVVDAYSNTQEEFDAWVTTLIEANKEYYAFAREYPTLIEQLINKIGEKEAKAILKNKVRQLDTWADKKRLMNQYIIGKEWYGK
ncbi:MAG: hypothetical protein B6V02_03280 [Thermoprotei archaeon ex4572_64]|nr:MAG: hypothetical protein B6V02_03280 [Thermoprotei archaeon ex4572_64]